ncbi:Fibrocystin-L (Polycystic kidney and hepatic disease 1-like protein 1) (PKHD1-like protein 1) (Protein D86) [Durusdinium trenchii]|uniref:Fibrocystin-L (Polycystic kidney and hepatic disease 1-like protein 1) (PKHD1-like protein 1) (Protein D86) n=1 Tax=Durusdinium trenchii TaxID=1381693 RepID=A0ABP0S2S8_9DINO
MEIGTEEKPFLHRALITLHGQKYETIRLPVIGGKVLAVSNTQFTIRELGDNAVEEGDIGALDIHGRPRLKVGGRAARTSSAEDIVDWKAGEELMATDIPHKHFNGNGLHGAPPVDFHNEPCTWPRVYIQSVATDMKTITLTTPLKYTHISTNYRRPLDDEFIDLSAEVALLSRNVKIQGEGYHSERDQWGGHTMVAFGGIYRIENAEFYRLGQTGEVSRYPIHFHITQDYGQNCYARYNSIHHSFQRAVAIHSTNYVNVKGNVAFDIIGHMFFVETGMEMHNTLEGNLAVGAIPLLSGMLESDQEPAGFWTAAPNNVWRDNVAVTGSDGWYFQLPDTPISHNMDIYKDSICPKGTRIGEWRRNRCHHLPGSCIRIYLTWIPRKDAER